MQINEWDAILRDFAGVLPKRSQLGVRRDRPGAGGRWLNSPRRHNIIFTVKFGLRTYFWSIRLLGLFGLLVLLGAQQKAVAFAQPKAKETPARKAPNSQNDRPRRVPITLQQTLPDGIAARAMSEIALSAASARSLPIFPLIENPSRGGDRSAPQLCPPIAFLLDSTQSRPQIAACNSYIAVAGDCSAFRVCVCRTGPPLAWGHDLPRFRAF